MYSHQVDTVRPDRLRHGSVPTGGHLGRRTMQRHLGLDLHSLTQDEPAQSRLADVAVVGGPGLGAQAEVDPTHQFAGVVSEARVVERRLRGGDRRVDSDDVREPLPQQIRFGGSRRREHHMGVVPGSWIASARALV